MAGTLFFRMMLRKFSEITNKQIFSQYNFFYKMNISFFNLRFDLFLIINKEVNQMRNSVVCVKAGLNILFCCALTTGRCNAFQHYFRKLNEIGVLRPIFPGYVFSCDYAGKRCFF